MMFESCYVDWEYVADILKKAINDIVDHAEEADVHPIIRCYDCCYWRDEVVITPDGRMRVVTDQEKHEGRRIPKERGIRKKSVCLYDKNRCGASPVEREWDDYCSRKSKREIAYEDFYGIKDGFYPYADKEESDAD